MTLKRLIPLLMLVGCVTPQTMRNRTPDFTSTSNKTVVDIAGCIGLTYSRQVSVVPIPGGTSFITRGGSGITDVMIEVADVGGTRSVKFYARDAPISLIDKSKTIEKIKACL